MYIVIVGNEIVTWAKTFKQAHKEALNYERLNGKQPLNADGTETSLEKGKVIKFGLDSYTYKNYDFVLNDITDALKDHEFVMTAYVFNGNVTKYFQGTVSETVTGVSYNDISNAE